MTNKSEQSIETVIVGIAAGFAFIIGVGIGIALHDETDSSSDAANSQPQTERNYQPN